MSQALHELAPSRSAREFIEVVRAAGARRQPEEQSPCRDPLRLAPAGRDRRAMTLTNSASPPWPDTPLHLDLNGSAMAGGSACPQATTLSSG